MIEGTLQPSSNPGRYQVGKDEHAPDLTSSQEVSIWINGQWVEGTVHHGPLLYIVDGGLAQSGYYVVFDNGGICGLCTDMRVRLR